MFQSLEKPWKQCQAKKHMAFWIKNMSKIDNKTPTNYRPKQTVDALQGRVEYKSEKMKNYNWKDTLKKLDHIYVIW